MRARNGKAIRLIGLALAAGLLVAPISAKRALAQEATDLVPDATSGLEDRPALLSADHVAYDENAKVVTAQGNVEISQGERVVLADQIRYNTETEIVTAQGNITLLDPSGNVVFADYVELTGDFREGFIQNIRVLLSDNTRMAGSSARRIGGNITELRNGVYSACKPCEEDPTRPPIWQIKALKVTHDQQEKMIKYRDAWFEVFGVPIVYTPFFEHPDPTVTRKSGFLFPSFGSSTLLGTTFQQPYFWAISPDRDLTIDPIFTTKQSVVLSGQYRQILPDGEIIIGGSGTISDRETDSGETLRDEPRGHVDASGRFDINDTWRWGFDVQRVTDDTYLRVYDFSSESTLTSQAFVEGFRGRNYASVQNFLYQGLRSSDVDDELPIVVPLIDYNFVSEPGIAGGTYRFDANFLNISRIDGRESRRLSFLGGWELPHTGPAGDVVTLRAQLEADAYHVEGVDPDSDLPNPTGDTEDGFTGRFFPQLAVEWRYPWVSDAGGISQVVEPIAQAVLAPGGSNPSRIANEDSLDFEFDDTNLFNLNRFPGRDRVDPGSRFDYGLKWTVTEESTGYASAFVGQSYRLKTDDVFRANSGLDDHFSDIVGRLQLQPSQYFDVAYRFRLDKDDLEVRRNEVTVSAGPPALRLSLDYLDLVGGVSEEFTGREEVTITLSSKLSDRWSAFISHQRDLVSDQSLETTLGVTYEDDCFLISGQIFRNRFEDREIEPEDAVFITVGLKNLGQFASQ